MFIWISMHAYLKMRMCMHVYLNQHAWLHVYLNELACISEYTCHWISMHVYLNMRIWMSMHAYLNENSCVSEWACMRIWICVSESACLHFWICVSESGLGIRSSVFPANRSFFVQKLENERFTHLLIFGERPKRFAHDRSFPLSDLSKSHMVAHFWWATWAICSHRSYDLSEMRDSLTLLTKKEEMSENERFAHFFNFFLKTLSKT